MPTYAFACGGCGWRTEQRAGYTTCSVACPVCGQAAPRASVYSLNFGGFARTPPAERDWSRDFTRFQEAQAETRAAPTFAQAKRAAQDLMRKGAKDANDLPTRI